MSGAALWACLELPALPLDVFARARMPDDTRPFAVGSGGHTPRIVLADATARDAGLRAGQLVSAALALAPDLVLRDRDPAAEAAALACVATWIAQFTPMVTLAPPVAVLADIGGSLRLFGGRQRLAALLAAGARDLGYTARLAFAPTPAAALAFARAGLVGTATPSALDAALAPLPLAHFDVDSAARELLAAAGVGTFGAAAALPRDGLARRVGPAFVRTLDRARGAIPDPRPPFVPPPRYEGRLELPAAVERTDALAFAVQRLVHELAGWLLGRGLGVTRLALTLAHERWAVGRDTPAATTVGFALAAPARDVPHLVGVLRERLARLELPAPVVALTLASAEAAPLAEPQSRPAARRRQHRRRAADRPAARAAGRTRRRLGRPARGAPARARAHRSGDTGARPARRTTGTIDRATRSRDGHVHYRRARSRHARCRRAAASSGPVRTAPAVAADRAAAVVQPARKASVGAARRPRTHRIGLVGRRRRAPRLLRRGEPYRRARVDLPRPPLRRRRRRVVPARRVRLRPARAPVPRIAPRHGADDASPAGATKAAGNANEESPVRRPVQGACVALDRPDSARTCRPA